MEDFLNSMALLLILLNPFLMVIYLLDLVQDLNLRSFTRVLMRAGLISVAVFILFALVGDAVFSKLLRARFASFQIFGGLIFLIIGIRFVFRGPEAIRGLRGKPERIAGSIAMPIMIGPATVSASIITGKRLDMILAVLVIFLSVGISVMIIIALKYLHDYVRPRNELLIERYVEVAGRVTALVVGTFSIEMIMTGIRSWMSLGG